MTQYLIRTLTDSTGTPFTHVTKARENERFTVVEAKSKEEAKEKDSNRYALYNYDEQLCTGTLDDVTYMMKKLGNHWKSENIDYELEVRKDSE